MSSYGLSEVNCRVCEQKRGTYDEPDVDSKVLPAFQFSPDDYQGGRRVIGSLLHKNVPRILSILECTFAADLFTKSLTRG